MSELVADRERDARVAKAMGIEVAWKTDGIREFPVYKLPGSPVVYSLPHYSTNGSDMLLALDWLKARGLSVRIFIFPSYVEVGIFASEDIKEPVGRAYAETLPFAVSEAIIACRFQSDAGVCGG